MNRREKKDGNSLARLELVGQTTCQPYEFATVVFAAATTPQINRVVHIHIPKRA